MQCAAGEVCEGDINSCRDVERLATLKWERERDVSPVITGGVLIEGLIAILEMHDGCRRRAAYTHNVSGQARINCDGRVRARGIIRCP